jgi:hypothetical protein
VERIELHLIAVGRFDQLFDAGTDDKHGNITLSPTHNFSTQLSFGPDAFASYQTEPDFGFKSKSNTNIASGTTNR